MKSILILNGSHSEIPLIKSAKGYGNWVVTTGNNRELVGHRMADEYSGADFMNRDEVLKIAQEKKINYICSCAHDGGALTASYVAEKLSLPGHDPVEISEIIHLKDKFKQYCIGRPILTPVAKSFGDLGSAISFLRNDFFSCIVKPVDMAGGKGISKICKLEDAENAIIRAFKISKSNRIVIEEFVEGTQHSFSSFIVNKAVKTCFSDNEYSSLNPYTVSTSCAPANNWELVKNQLIDTANYLASDLNICDGLLHFQYILNNNRAYILEITRRCSGDLYSEPVSLSLGFNWANWILKSAMGLDCSDIPVSSQSGFYGRHCLMADQNGKLLGYQFADEIKENIVNVVYAYEPNAIITNYKNQKLAVVIMKFSNAKEMLHKTENAHNLMKAIIEN